MDGFANYVFRDDADLGPNQYAFVTIASTPAFFSLFLKVTADGQTALEANFHEPDDHIHIGWSGREGVDIYNFDTVDLPLEVGDRVAFVAYEDGRAEIWINDALVDSLDVSDAAVADPPYPNHAGGGRIGLGTYASTRLRDFGGGELP
jgi:hypothetical protein